MSGIATPRETIDINGLSFPVYGPSFARWYPFGSTGFGYNLGYVNYDPWYYSRSRWIWGWNGLWYDPYDPFGYNSWYGYNAYGYGSGYPGYANSYGGGSYKTSDENDHVGSIRLKANPSQAEVYVDGALMGVVDDFDGFSSHLKLAGGNHTIELKADGYEPYTGKVFVSVGKTVTERISLKKKK